MISLVLLSCGGETVDGCALIHSSSPCCCYCNHPLKMGSSVERHGLTFLRPPPTIVITGMMGWWDDGGDGCGRSLRIGVFCIFLRSFFTLSVMDHQTMWPFFVSLCATHSLVTKQTFTATEGTMMNGFYEKRAVTPPTLVGGYKAPWSQH